MDARPICDLPTLTFPIPSIPTLPLLFLSGDYATAITCNADGDFQVGSIVVPVEWNLYSALEQVRRAASLNPPGLPRGLIASLHSSWFSVLSPAAAGVFGGRWLPWTRCLPSP